MFSLAAVLVYAATGRSPFLAADEELDLPALLYRIVHDEPRLDGVHEALLPLVRACLAKDPEQRPSAADVAARLEGGQKDGWGAVVPPRLVAEAGRREAELRQLLTASQPPAHTPGTHEPTPTPTPILVPEPAPAPAPHLPPYPADGTTPSSPAPPSSAKALLRSRGAGAAAGAVVVAAAVALAVALPGRGDADGAAPHGSSSGPTSPTATPTATAAASTGALPAAWTGTWAGTGPGTPDADGISRARTGAFAVTVTLNGGAVGELVGRQVSDVKEVATGRNLGCTEALQLRQIRGNNAVFEAVTSHPTDPAAVFDCPRGNLYVLTMAEADRLTLESEGAQSAGAPAALTRRP
ncbi:hypothetical protein [Streptomyces avidinii]|uniref:hypothetical protein n=1 Tax=Streptomyces avidinii TaxID=1895 RepID=UPI003863E2B1